MIRNLKIVVSSLVIILALLLVGITDVIAHAPHDDIFQIELSPTYDEDQTLLTIVRGNLLKSENDGSSWKRVINGLDNIHRLYSLDISSQSKETMFLSSLGDGVYKSKNEGSSWSKVNNGLETLDIDLLEISPNNVDIVLAAGTKTGLYKTNNGGTKWEQVVLNSKKITSIVFLKSTKDIIFVGDSQGKLFYSDDGGDVWQHIFTANSAITSIALSPSFTRDKTLLIGLEKGNILKATDGGKSFSVVNQNISGQPILSLVFSPNYDTDSTFFALDGYDGIFLSNDKGNAWQQSNNGLTSSTQAYEFKRPYFSELKLSPTFDKDHTLLLAGYDGLFKSTNDGQSWQEISTLSLNSITNLALSPNYSNDSTVMIGTYLWGAYTSDNQGSTWTSQNRGMVDDRNTGIARTFNFVFSPNYAVDKTIFAVTSSRFLRSTNKGRSWETIGLTNIPKKLRTVAGGQIAISPNFEIDHTIYLGTAKGAILKSTNKGKNFSLISQLNNRIISLVISPSFTTDQMLFASIPDAVDKLYVQKTVDGGVSWQPSTTGIDLGKNLDENPKDDKGLAVKLAISSNYETDQTMFAGTANGVFKTQNQGGNWAKLTSSLFDDNGLIEAIVLSPDYKNDQTLIVCMGGVGLFKSNDGGQTFTQIGQDLLKNNYLLSNMYGFRVTSGSAPLQFSPSYAVDKVIYGYSDTEIFMTKNAGKTWEYSSLPDLPNDSLSPFYISYLRFKSSPILIFLTAALVSFLSYVGVTSMQLGRSLSRPKKLLIKFGSTIVVFMLVFFVLSW